jgi:hypothetical protein
MNWKEIEDRIVLDDRNKWDKRATAGQLQIDQAGRLEFLDGLGLDGFERESYPLSDLAVGQMCQRLEIPTRYYRRLSGLMQALVAGYDLNRLKDETFLLRGKGDLIRAFLSSRYVTYNNAQIAETVEGLLGDSPVRVKSFVLEETHMFTKVIADEIADPASGLKAGIMIGNSEVGLGSVSVEPFVFRLACTNDLVVAREKSFRHAHINLSAAELTRRVAEAVGETFEIADSLMGRFLEARRDPIPDPVETIRRLAEARKLSRKVTDDVLSSYQAEPERSRFGVINAFTSTARGLAPLERINMERFAGTLLEARL